MLPISHLPAPPCRALQGVAFDVDDTLTRAGRLQTAALEGLWRLRAAGLRTAAVTGRPLGWCEVMAQQWPIDLAVGENGAGWVWSSSRGSLRAGFFEAEERRRDQRALALECAAQITKTLPDLVPTQDQWARRVDLAFDIGESRRLPRTSLQKLEKLVAARGGNLVVSSVHAHVFFGQWDKAQGLARAHSEVWAQPLRPEHWLFVGDSANDAPCFEAFEHSVGVANVREHFGSLPTPPRYVTDLGHGEGFAEVVDHVLQARAALGESSLDQTDR